MDCIHRNNLLYGVSAPIRRAAEIAQRYKTRNPFEIIERRRIRLRLTCRFMDLLGYFIIKNKVQHIGVNANAPAYLQRTVAAHELGHAILHYLEALAQGSLQDDTMLYSAHGGKMENEANLFAGELLLCDEEILEECAYYDYERTIQTIREESVSYGSPRDRHEFEREMMDEFYERHPYIPTYETLAQEHGVDIHLVEFKFLALKQKGYDVPNLPEVKSDFLRR